MIRRAKANALWLDDRAWTGLRPFSRQNRVTKAIALWSLADDFPWESTFEKVVPLRRLEFVKQAAEML
jgi:hypothetical protein